MIRLDDWRVRLHDLISAKENEPFKYGVNDCCLFGADVVLALTGTDLAAEYRGKYKSLSGGLKAIKASGYRSQLEFLEKNFEEIHPAFAGAGDLAIIEFEGIKSIVVVAGPFVVGISQAGLIRVDNEYIVKAYKV